MPQPSIHARYLAADRAYRDHVAGCSGCGLSTPATDGCEGTRLHDVFTRLQDAYLTHLKRQRPQGR
ncbi:hypothetical protein [Streptomyces sp. NPDC048508]|uniref:hypothetical protein n=1 Tax=Streptomyces sp. NPDC048508 TaxID=3365561 RepID=UPI003724BEBC